MAVDIFTKEQFENGLPVHNKTNERLWQPLGIVKGEYCYLVTPFADRPFKIYVRSSVDSSGYNRATGEDSIRCHIVLDQEGEYLTWGNKSQKYVTRVRGWETRLTDVLRLLAGQIKETPIHCPKCGKSHTVKPFIAKKGKPENKGRRFLSCYQEGCGFFKWLD